MAKGANPPKVDAKGRVQIISVVTSVFGFFTLVVLAVEGGLFAAASYLNSPRALYAGCGILVLLIVSVVLIVLVRPEALGIQRVRDNFPHLLGTRFYRALNPYLLNLPPTDVEEALEYIESALQDSAGFNKSEAGFASSFTASVIGEGRALLNARRVGG
jgi:hypothetical protein